MDVLLLIETNFLLDITFQQFQHCERLLSFAQEQSIPVVVPEYCFAEAEGNIGKTIQKRFAAIDTAIVVLKQSARSTYHDVAPLINQLEKEKKQNSQNQEKTTSEKTLKVVQIILCVKHLTQKLCDLAFNFNPVSIHEILNCINMFFIPDKIVWQLKV